MVARYRFNNNLIREKLREQPCTYETIDEKSGITCLFDIDLHVPQLRKQEGIKMRHYKLELLFYTNMASLTRQS